MKHLFPSTFFVDSVLFYIEDEIVLVIDSNSDGSPKSLLTHIENPLWIVHPQSSSNVFWEHVWKQANYLLGRGVSI